jgi:fluoroacetyl-CoA thioesterase
MTVEVTHVVAAADTAIALGSGDLPVLATPRLIAWCEAASCAALTNTAGQTSVGTRINIEHVAATPVGASVTATAIITTNDGHRVCFDVAAHDVTGRLLAHGTIERAVVDRARFMARVDRMGD